MSFEKAVHDRHNISELARELGVTTHISGEKV
jgi:hypothetical protein